MRHTPLTKPGQHGTLYRFAVIYTDGDFSDTWHTWAYDSEHALERFFEGPDGEGWTPLRWARLTDGPASTQTWHEA